MWFMRMFILVHCRNCFLEEDIVIAENTSVGENSHISHSVIGKNCHIGKNVTICNSYVWDNVTVGDNCHINFTLVGHQSKLGTGVRLSKGCVLCPGVVLPLDTHLEGSILVASSEQNKESLEQDEAYKLEKLADKAYCLHVDQAEYDCEAEGRAQHLCGLWLGTSGLDSKSDSEEDLSASSEMSDHASPVPDDIHLFFSEVMDSLTRGYDDKLHPDNLILEINSSRYAYNVSVREVNYFVVKALLSLPIQAQSADSGLKYVMEFSKMLRDLFPILQNYVRNSDAQDDCLQALEDMAASTDTVCEGLLKLLHLLYDKDILGEDAILKWYNSDDKSSTAAALRKQVAPFIKWLEEADEESDESQSD
ncbi:hypothetical protein B7P43_G16441 [Cryptotermes secundus]|uniref:Translation initiation factor eIF2B subunit epsilon n=1 Tax=Cryptotermes secundus TaxID=105785 RepID=A0A2J7QH95_9NEOP|nr:hypothetical protein B7P43_G16441 [Cryptotermes secundus]